MSDKAMTLRLDPDQHAALKIIADARGASVSDVVRQAIREFYERLQHHMAPIGDGSGMRRCSKCHGIEANYDPKTPLCTGVSS